jgi:hypothetical protein
LVDNFYEAFNISVVLREFNQLIDSLSVVFSNFKIPTTPQIKYEIKMRYKPSIPNNIKCWQVFKDDQQIKISMEMIDEFTSTHINSDDEEGTK